LICRSGTGEDAIPDETTILKLHLLLERQKLTEQLLATINDVLEVS